MSSLKFHKCKICEVIFYRHCRSTYCSKCVPKVSTASGNHRMAAERLRLSDIDYKQKQRARWREYWHRKMESPEFREKERLRSLARARAEKKYLVKEGKNE